MQLFQKLAIVFVLGFSSGLPLALLSSTLQAWFAQAGVSLMLTSSLSLMSLPYLLRFLWAPFLDRYQLLPLGVRRGWICSMQILLIFGVQVIVEFQPNISPGIMAVLALVLAIFSATQDTAIDAHRIEYLPPKYYGLGASLANTGYRLGMLLSGGFALVIAQNYGWIFAYRIMSAALMVGVLAILWSKEPSKSIASKSGVLDNFIDPVKDLLNRSDILSFCSFVLMFKLGGVFTTAVSGMVMPFLIQGLGFSLATIGYIYKIWGTVALIVGGIVGGVVMLRMNLYRALLYFGLIQGLTNLFFVGLAWFGKNLVLLSIAVITDNFAAGMGSTALVALIMRFVNQKFTATQFSILAGIAGLPRIVSGPIGAGLQSHFGWVGLYSLAFLLSFLFVPLLFKIKPQLAFSGVSSPGFEG